MVVFVCRGNSLTRWTGKERKGSAMNVVNRLLIIIALLLALVIVTVVCLFPEYVVGQLLIFFTSLDSLVARVMWSDRMILIGVATLVNIGLILFLALELYRPQAKEVRITSIEGGDATISVDSIKQRLSFYIDGLADVASAKPKVRIKGDKVLVSVDVQTVAAVNVPAKAREVVAVIQMVIQETMGLELRSEPRVRIQTGSYRDMTLTAVTAAPAVLPEPVLEEE
jgi:hypothetical protein